VRDGVCPRCMADYQGHPALSRLDNRTEICPACGVAEALEIAGYNTALVNGLLAESGEYSESDEVADAQRDSRDTGSQHGAP